METLLEYFRTLTYYLFNPQALIPLAGYVGLTAIIFAETGLLIGFFLPGDSLLVTAGLFAAKGDLDITLLCGLLTVAAIVGDTVGYHIGKKTGPMLYRKEDSLLFKKSHLLAAHAFYEKHGGKTIIFARFMPIVRTFAPTVAGAANMPYGRFLMFNVVGGIIWIFSLTLGGYFLGKSIAGIDKYIHVIIGVVLFLSILPAIIKWISVKRRTSADLASEKPKS
jgi:membrane-associated protein